MEENDTSWLESYEFDDSPAYTDGNGNEITAEEFESLAGHSAGNDTSIGTDWLSDYGSEESEPIEEVKEEPVEEQEKENTENKVPEELTINTELPVLPEIPNMAAIEKENDERLKEAEKEAEKNVKEGNQFAYTASQLSHFLNNPGSNLYGLTSDEANQVKEAVDNGEFETLQDAANGLGYGDKYQGEVKDEDAEGTTPEAIGEFIYNEGSKALDFLLDGTDKSAREIAEEIPNATMQDIKDYETILNVNLLTEALEGVQTYANSKGLDANTDPRINQVYNEIRDYDQEMFGGKIFDTINKEGTRSLETISMIVLPSLVAPVLGAGIQAGLGGMSNWGSTGLAHILAHTSSKNPVVQMLARAASKAGVAPGMVRASSIAARGVQAAGNLISGIAGASGIAGSALTGTTKALRNSLNPKVEKPVTPNISERLGEREVLPSGPSFGEIPEIEVKELPEDVVEKEVEKVVEVDRSIPEEKVPVVTETLKRRVEEDYGDSGSDSLPYLLKLQLENLKVTEPSLVNPSGGSVFKDTNYAKTTHKLGYSNKDVSATDEGSYNKGLTEKENSVVSDACKKVVIYGPGYIKEAIHKFKV